MGSGILKCFIRSTFNITKVCIIISHLTLFGTTPFSTHQLDWYCLPTFKNKAGTGRGGGGWWVARENLLRVMKVIYSVLMMVHCGDRLKLERLLTLIRLFEYRNTGTRVVLFYDKNYYMPGSNYSCIQSFA